MNNQEIEFWKKHAKDSTLVRALRAEPQRAITFFGSYSVLGENEAELYRTIEAYEIASAGEAELLVKMNNVVHSVVAQSDERISPELRTQFETSAGFTIDHIHKMKRIAQEHLQKLFS